MFKALDSLYRRTMYANAVCSSHALQGQENLGPNAIPHSED